MGLRIRATTIALSVIWTAAMLAAAFPAMAQPARIALVVGNGNYSSFPALLSCPESSRDVANALRSLGYRVVERQDVTSGGMAAAIGEFSGSMETTPDASVFVYICGYAAGFNDRPFLLPVSANIRRPSDLMTQGILAKAFLDLLSPGSPSRGLVALDLVTAPDASAPVLDTLTEVPVPDGSALIAVIGRPPAAGPTALAVALAAELAVPGVQSGTLLNSVESHLSADPAAQIGALRMPSVSLPLAADEQPSLTTDSSLPGPVQPAESVETAADATAAAAGDTASIATFPDEGAMTTGERRRVQEALTRVGYYAGGIDGIFGPETRAAIRRFQYEIGVEKTGVITGAQAARLLAWQ
jgi:uncharacterized caspase-like protein